MSILAFLDYSSAFEPIDHSAHLRHLENDFRLADSVLQYSLYYLTDRTQNVSLSNHCVVLLMYTLVFLRVQFFAQFFFRVY